MFRTALWLFRTLFVCLNFFSMLCICKVLFLQSGWRLSVTFGPLLTCPYRREGITVAGFAVEVSQYCVFPVPSRVGSL